jgi:ParB-like chromosome segregation protein Spo0J
MMRIAPKFHAPFPSEAYSVQDLDATTQLESLAATLTQHAVSHAHDHDDEPPARGGREGLPKTYRSRHDSHYVEQLSGGGAMPLLRMLPPSRIDAVNLPEAGDLGALAASVAQHGVLQPLLVRAHDGRFSLIDGRRRLSAARAAAMREVPCLVYTVDEEQAAHLGEASNVQEAPPVPPSAVAPVDAPAVACDPLTAATLAELQHALGTVRGCLQWLPRARTTTRERVAARLLAADLDRAEWLVRARQYLAGALRVALRPTKVADIAADVTAMAPAVALHGGTLEVDASKGDHVFTADRALLSHAARGLAWALLAAGEAAGDMRVRVSIAPAQGRTVLAVSEPAAVFAQPALLQFFEAGWTKRPGGAAAEAAVLIARYAAAQHGAQLEVTAAAGAGTTVTLTFG